MGCFCYDLATKPRLKDLFTLKWPRRERKQIGSSSLFQALCFELPFPCHQGPAPQPRWVGGVTQLSSCGGQVSPGEAKWPLRPLQRWNQSSPGLSAVSPSLPDLSSDKREESGKLEPHLPLCEPQYRAREEPAGRWAGWRAHQVGQGALLAVDQTRTFAGHPPRLHSQQAGLRSWLPGHHLRGAPGKASGGFTELLRTGPYLSQEPGWYSTNKPKPGAGRQKSGRGVLAKGYDACWKHLPQDPG